MSTIIKQSRVMKSGNHSKNGASLKSRMSRRNNKMKQLLLSATLLLSLSFILNSCSTSQQGAGALIGGGMGAALIGGKSQSTNTLSTITVNSEPSGARVIANGTVVCSSTPCEVTVSGGRIEFTFIKDGYVVGKEVCRPSIQIVNGKQINTYPNVFHIFQKQTYAEDPTIRAGEATNMVTRDNPGGTALERTIIRWFFDSEPRGARIFWRVISSVPDQVKNTNELYLTSTPYEETRSFNILGLTYENSRDVVIEIKATRPGYMDQVKRYNVRQAIDQAEISGFFDLVPQ